MNGSSVRMKWNGKELTISVVKPLTAELYKELKAMSPDSIAFLILKQSAAELQLAAQYPSYFPLNRLAIEEVNTDEK